MTKHVANLLPLDKERTGEVSRGGSPLKRLLESRPVVPVRKAEDKREHEALGQSEPDHRHVVPRGPEAVDVRPEHHQDLEEERNDYCRVRTRTIGPGHAILGGLQPMRTQKQPTGEFLVKVWLGRHFARRVARQLNSKGTTMCHRPPSIGRRCRYCLHANTISHHFFFSSHFG